MSSKFLKPSRMNTPLVDPEPATLRPASYLAPHTEIDPSMPPLRKIVHKQRVSIAEKTHANSGIAESPTHATPTKNAPRRAAIATRTKMTGSARDAFSDSSNSQESDSDSDYCQPGSAL